MCSDTLKAICPGSSAARTSDASRRLQYSGYQKMKETAFLEGDREGELMA